MKIINRYVLKEHFGPFVFALSALTSLLLLQYVARKFGDLVGKGLAWQTIVEFFLLSIPFTVAMTLPMAVLVAVLYAFSRLASENEITALKAGGISTRSLLRPTLGAAVLLSLFMLWFNDQLLSRANHELATLQLAILRTKPTFALKPQVINVVKESQLYLRADEINQDESGRMAGITIYDVSDNQRRKSIYAQHGTLTFAPNRRDLVLRLYDGVIISAPSERSSQQIDRIYYKEDQLKIRDVANSFTPIGADSSAKTEREMNVCEMQEEFDKRSRALERAQIDSQIAAWQMKQAKGDKSPRPVEPKTLKPGGGIGQLYCTFITRYLHVSPAQAAELPPRLRVRQDTSKTATAKKSDSVYVLTGGLLKKVPRNKIPPGAYIPETAAAHATTPPATTPTPPPNIIRPGLPAPAAAATPANTPPVVTPPPPSAGAGPVVSESPSIALNDSRIRIEEARHWRNRYAVEIQKKFSLAFACIVFVLVGAPIALRFPRGGVGLVMGVGFFVFAIYYVGLIGGEELANKNIVSPFWAMWIDNIIFLIVGLLFVWRMGNEATTGRGGGFAEAMDNVRRWFQRDRGASA